MSSADMSMSRDHEDGGYNLAIGEPFFLQHVYKNEYDQLLMSVKANGCGYPSIAGEKRLIEKLEERHPGHHIVLANGAKQALSAALYAFRSTPFGSAYRYLEHRRPYWPSYPTLASLAGMGFVCYGNHMSLKVTTWPNNPDGSTREDGLIWDAAYASPIYGWDGKEPLHDVSVWSAAKLFGLSGCRIGWLAAKNPHFAKDAAEYVEKTTSGVSKASQTLLMTLLQKSQALAVKEVEARSLLLSTAAAFSALRPLFVQVQGLPATGKGMFAWVKAKDPKAFEKALTMAKVKVIKGEYCGETEGGWYRISLGVMPETMYQAAQTILAFYQPSSINSDASTNQEGK